MGFRFQKRISILPGVRINLSKSGVSTSLGPRGADVNIGKDGVTANAGIPGTGLSYRQKVGKGGWLAVLLVMIGGLGVWAFQHIGNIEVFSAPSALRTASVATASGSLGREPDPTASASRTGEARPGTGAAKNISTHVSTEASTDGASTSPAATDTSANMLRYVHRPIAILREEPSTSSNILKRELKGSSVTLVSQGADGWSEVMDGNITGYMRSGTLGTEPPR